jgi:lipoprotein-releasing system permease protein
VLCQVANSLHLVALPAEIYAVSSITLRPGWRDSGWIALLTIAISLIATLYPSRTASRLPPVEALRYE